MFISLGSLVSELAESRSTLAQVQAEIDETASRIEENKNLLENSTEDELIEKAARERLGFVYPNEQVFVDISGN
jgi:cell division protein FtsB